MIYHGTNTEAEQIHEQGECRDRANTGRKSGKEHTMLLDAINHYLKYYAPENSEIDVLHRMRARQQAHKVFQDSFDSQMNQAFIRIERVTSAEPVHLFGQHVPSYAFNRISVNRGMNDETGQRVPGNSLLTALISEESLARLMLSTNRTSNRIALTLESALGEMLPTDRRHTRKTSNTLLEERIDENHQKRILALFQLKTRINELDKAPGKKTSEEYIDVLDRIRRTDTSFMLQRHSENLGNDMVQYRTEAANAALNIAGLLKDAERLKLLEGPEPDPADITDVEMARNGNPLLDHAMKLYRPEEALICRKAVLSWLEDQINKNFPEGLDYDLEESDPQGQRLNRLMNRNDGNKVNFELLGKLAGLASTLGNSHSNEDRAKADGYGLTASVSRVSGGNINNLHSSVPVTEHEQFSLRISTGIIEEDFGNEGIRESGTFLELGLSTEDLMTALRGHPTGDFTPCSLDWLESKRINRISYRTELNREIDEAATADRSDRPESGNADYDRSRFECYLRDAKSILREGSRTAVERRRLKGLLTQAYDIIENVLKDEADEIMARADRMNNHVGTMARSAMSSINDHVREEHGVNLALFDDGAGQNQELIRGPENEEMQGP